MYKRQNLNDPNTETDERDRPFLIPAQRIYFNKEVAIGMTLGLIAGAGWKWNHWQHRSAQQEYYAALAKKNKK